MLVTAKREGLLMSAPSAERVWHVSNLLDALHVHSQVLCVVNRSDLIQADRNEGRISNDLLHLLLHDLKTCFEQKHA